MILAFESVCILVGLLPLAAGYIHSNLASVAIGCLIIGLLWFLSVCRGWKWAGSLGLFIFISIAGMGIWIGLSPTLMAISVVGSLLAWDLDVFLQRLRNAAEEDDLQPFKKRHLLRSASLGSVSLVLVLLALFIHVRISFGWLFLMALGGVYGMIQLVNRLRMGG